MSNDNDQDLRGIGMITGGIVCVAIGSILIKAFTKFLSYVGKFFDTLAHSATAFAILCFSVFKVAVVVVAGLGLIYFTYYVIVRYRKLVKEATQTRVEIAEYKNEVKAHVESEVKKMEVLLSKTVRRLENHVSQALKPPEVAAPPKAEISQSSERAPNNEANSAPRAESLASSVVTTSQTAQNIESHISSVTNPY